MMTGYCADPSRSGAFPSVTDCAWLLASLVLMRQAGGERHAHVHVPRKRGPLSRRVVATRGALCCSVAAAAKKKQVCRR